MGIVLVTALASPTGRSEWQPAADGNRVDPQAAIWRARKLFRHGDERFFAAATTGTSTAVNAMHDSFTPLGGLVPCSTCCSAASRRRRWRWPLWLLVLAVVAVLSRADGWTHAEYLGKNRNPRNETRDAAVLITRHRARLLRRVGHGEIRAR